jgi:hypothetical protein
MKTKILFFLFFFLFIFLSTGVNAYEIFNTNPYFTSNNNGYYIADSFSNETCFFWWCSNNTYSCFDVQNITGKLVLSNSSRCNFTNDYNFAGITIKMLSDNSFYKMNNGDYIYMLSKPNSKWCDQPEVSPFGINPPNYNYTPPVCSGYDYMVLPKNKQGIIALNYSIYDNYNLDNQYTLLEVWENGVTLLNSTFIGSANLTPELKTLIIQPASYDRNITVFASWKWYTPIATQIPVTNITINKFQFYTLDISETRTDYTNNDTYELERYCGVNTSILTPAVPGENKSSFYNNTSFSFRRDANNLICGYVRLNDLIISRNWNYYNPDYTIYGLLNFFWSRDSFLINDVSCFQAFFEQFLRTQAKITVLHSNGTCLGEGNQFNKMVFQYNDVYSTEVNAYSFKYNYSEAFRETVSLINNSNISISNQNPSGNAFKYFTNVEVEYNWTRNSSYIPFFTSNIQVENTGWYCSNILNMEYFITFNGSIINEQYCGDVGCNADHTHCNFHYVGIYCENDYDWIYSDVFGVIDSGSCPNNTICINQTNGIGCFNNATQTYIQCLDINGVITDCVSVENPETSKSIFVNPLNFLAINIGSLAGQQNNLPLSQVMFSFLVALIISITAMIIGRKSRHIEKVLGLSFVGSIIFFTFAFFGNIYLIAITIIFIIMSAGILSGIFNKWFGGG